MTTTVETAAVSGVATGRVARVIGPVVDVEFPAEAMPEIYFALHVDITYGGETRTLTLEVDDPVWATPLRYLESGIVETLAEHLGPGVVQAVKIAVRKR